MDTLVVRRMTEDELGLALDWAAEEGWNPGLFNSASFIAADPDGFFLGECDGEPIGSVSAVRYGERFGFLGLYIVKPQHRGRGFGLKLWRAAMEHFGDRIIGLDGVVAQQHNYKVRVQAAQYPLPGRGRRRGARWPRRPVVHPVRRDPSLRCPGVSRPPRTLPSTLDRPAAFDCARNARTRAAHRLWRPARLPPRLQDRSALRRRSGDRRPRFSRSRAPRARGTHCSQCARSEPRRRRARPALRHGAGLRDRADVHQGGPVGRPEPMFWRDDVRARLAHRIASVQCWSLGSHRRLIQPWAAAITARDRAARRIGAHERLFSRASRVGGIFPVSSPVLSLITANYFPASFPVLFPVRPRAIFA